MSTPLKRALHGGEFSLSKRTLEAIAEDIDATLTNPGNPLDYMRAKTVPREMFPLLRTEAGETIYSPNPRQLEKWIDQHNIFGPLRNLTLTPRQKEDYAYDYYNFLSNGALEKPTHLKTSRDFADAIRELNIPLTVKDRALEYVVDLERRKLTVDEFWGRQSALLGPVYKSKIIEILQRPK